MFLNIRTRIGISCLISLCACASPKVVETVKVGDNALSCTQLQNEYEEAERFRAEADKEKGVTGGNAARVLFWPALVGTYLNANDAITAANTRKENIVRLMNSKSCTNQAGAKAPDNSAPN